MQRKVKIYKKLPSFSMNIDELEQLLKRFMALFDSSQSVNISIEIVLSQETIEFTSVSELREFDELPNKINELYIRLSQNDKYLSIRDHGISNYQVYVSAKNVGGEAWCTGASQLVHKKINSHRTWYSWLKSMSMAIYFSIFVFIHWLLNYFYLSWPEQYQKYNTAIDLIWGATWIFTIFLFIINTSNRFFPNAVLKIKDTDGFIRRYYQEITAILLVASILIPLVVIALK